MEQKLPQCPGVSRCFLEQEDIRDFTAWTQPGHSLHRQEWAGGLLRSQESSATPARGEGIQSKV